MIIGTNFQLQDVLVAINLYLNLYKNLESLPSKHNYTKNSQKLQMGFTWPKFLDIINFYALYRKIHT